jgi:hypothetical protein
MYAAETRSSLEVTQSFGRWGRSRYGSGLLAEAQCLQYLCLLTHWKNTNQIGVCNRGNELDFRAEFISMAALWPSFRSVGTAAFGRKSAARQAFSATCMCMRTAKNHGKFVSSWSVAEVPDAFTLLASSREFKHSRPSGSLDTQITNVCYTSFRICSFWWVTDGFRLKREETKISENFVFSP